METFHWIIFFMCMELAVKNKLENKYHRSNGWRHGGSIGAGDDSPTFVCRKKNWKKTAAAAAAESNGRYMWCGWPANANILPMQSKCILRFHINMHVWGYCVKLNWLITGKVWPVRVFVSVCNTNWAQTEKKHGEIEMKKKRKTRNGKTVALCYRTPWNIVLNIY